MSETRYSTLTPSWLFWSKVKDVRGPVGNPADLSDYMLRDINLARPERSSLNLTGLIR